MLRVPTTLLIHWHKTSASSEQIISFLGERVNHNLQNAPPLQEHLRKKISQAGSTFKKLKGEKSRHYYEGMTKVILQENHLTPVGKLIDELDHWQENADKWREECKKKEDEAAEFYYYLLQERERKKRRRRRRN